MNYQIYLKEIDDLEVIREILIEPEMWDRISEDGQKKEDFIISDNPAFIWVGVFSRGNITRDRKLIGIFFLHALNKTTLQIHAHIKKEFRKEFAKRAGKEIISYFVNETDFEKLLAEIPVVYQDVYHYTKSFGFIDEGINRQSFLKKGKVIDQYRLGLTRKEAKKWLLQQY